MYFTDVGTLPFLFLIVLRYLSTSDMLVLLLGIIIGIVCASSVIAYCTCILLEKRSILIHHEVLDGCDYMISFLTFLPGYYKRYFEQLRRNLHTFYFEYQELYEEIYTPG